MRAKVTTHVLLGRKSLGCPARELAELAAVGTTWEGSSRQCCESSKVQVLAPSIACITEWPGSLAAARPSQNRT